MKQLVSTNWLEKNIENVKILDATWHLPNSGRKAEEEYKLSHIKNSIFFDIDRYSNQTSSLPHMLPSKTDWENIVSDLGIKNSDHIIVYDNSDLFSSCRVWFTFIHFGHNSNLISVLNGNFEKWLKEKKPVTKEITRVTRTKYEAEENTSLIVNKRQVEQNINNKQFQLIDARGEKRFLGLQPEPRKGMRSGHIKGSINLPFQLLINKDRTFKKVDELISVFEEKKISIDQDKAFSCGSGITACILGLANSLITDKKPKIYDGSWAEFGLEN
tara:strand:+ start:328 stop:1143 length:816 start_codon:yes stop_codon:yes gene_type:complete